MNIDSVVGCRVFVRAALFVAAAVGGDVTVIDVLDGDDDAVGRNTGAGDIDAVATNDIGVVSVWLSSLSSVVVVVVVVIVGDGSFRRK